MKPCALCRWIGSVLPGGYSTVIIRPSLPGSSGKSFEKSGVTFASLSWSLGCKVTDIRHTNSKASFVIVINSPFVCTIPLRLHWLHALVLAVTRNGGRVPVRQAANLPCRGHPAGHAIRRNSRRVGQSRRVWGPAYGRCIFPSPTHLRPPK